MNSEKDTDKYDGGSQYMDEETQKSKKSDKK